MLPERAHHEVLIAPPAAPWWIHARPMLAPAQRRGDHVVLPVGVVPAMTARSAACRAVGKLRPRFSARRKIPAAAFGESESLGATRFCSTADKEDAIASLGDAKILAVQTPPADMRPALP